MGLTAFLEKRAQREILKRAIDGAWAASTCIGMVFGPLTQMLETTGAGKADVIQLVDTWLSAWRDVRHLSDRNLHRNRDDYEVKPNERLSPILLRFEEELVSIQGRDLSQPDEVLAAVKEATTATVVELYEFNNWAQAVGPSVGLDAEKYEGKAVAKAQRLWQPTLRELGLQA